MQSSCPVADIATAVNKDPEEIESVADIATAANKDPEEIESSIDSDPEDDMELISLAAAGTTFYVCPFSIVKINT